MPKSKNDWIIKVTLNCSWQWKINQEWSPQLQKRWRAWICYSSGWKRLSLPFTHTEWTVSRSVLLLKINRIERPMCARSWLGVVVSSSEVPNCYVMLLKTMFGDEGTKKVDSGSWNRLYQSSQLQLEPPSTEARSAQIWKAIWVEQRRSKSHAVPKIIRRPVFNALNVFFPVSPINLWCP